MKERNLEYGFVKRTFLYGGAGICGVSTDALSFWLIAALAPTAPIAITNLLTYSLGTITSFKINKQYSFRSKTHKLSLLRFYLTSVFGMLASTLILMSLLGVELSMLSSKTIATVAAVCIQYAINSKFSLVSK
jgi:putative flippase GtrA